MSCQKCNSDRVVNFHAKSSDMNMYSVDGKESPLNSYVPRDFGIGGGDYIKLTYCLDCGQIQGEFPLPTTDFEWGSEAD